MPQQIKIHSQLGPKKEIKSNFLLFSFKPTTYAFCLLLLRPVFCPRYLPMSVNDEQ